MPAAHSLLLFVLAVLGLMVSPGPNMAMVLSHSVAQGPRGGVVVAGGILAADLVMTVLTARGIVALVAAWPPSFVVLRYAGAAYLVLLAVRAWQSRTSREERRDDARSLGDLFGRAMLVSLLNPKALLFFLLWAPLGWFFAVVTLYVAYFFRDPDRVTQLRDGLVISPADGRVSMIEKVRPPAELALGTDERVRVSIFLSVLDVHINRAPVAGRIIRSVYIPGAFLNAALDKASEDNERNSLVISTPSGRIGVIQIAGLVARRIVSFAREGQTLTQGERFGLIRFGSRLDVFLPEGAKALVAEGQTAIAGETVLADFRLGDGGRSYRVD